MVYHLTPRGRSRVLAYQKFGHQVFGIVGEALGDLVLQFCNLLEAEILIPDREGG